MKSFHIVFAIVVNLVYPAHALEERHSDAVEPHTEYAHQEESTREASSNVGPGRAVQSANHERGIQLAPAALKRIGARFVALTISPPLLLKSAIVSRQETKGVYRLRDGWIKFVPGSTTPTGDRFRFIPTAPGELTTGDEVAVDGVPLLMVADLDAFSAGEGHGH